jgi:hypothetical protein
LLISWCQEASLPTEHKGPAAALSLTSREPLLPHQRARTPDYPLRGGKLKPATLQAAPEVLFLQGTHCTPLQESHVSPVQELESQHLHQVTIHYPAARRLAPHTRYRDPVPPTATAGEPLHPHQRPGTPAPSLRGERRQLVPQQEPCKG